jgi:benzoate transport
VSGKDPQAILNNGRMSAWQWAAVAMTIGLNALDGFDVLSISFAAPGLGKDWGLSPATLGWLLSMELVGMAVGSLVLGGVADRFGRRSTILGCLTIMTVGMASAGHTENVSQLVTARLLTGLGIGGMLAAINAATAEFANQRWRSQATALMVIGYPLGGVLGGLMVQRILGHGGNWRDVFMFGAWATAAFIPMVWILVPETPAFLDRRRPPGALEKINRSFARFGLGKVTQLSAVEAHAPRRSLMDIFKPDLIATTVCVTLAYFAHITAFYFILKWVPKLVVDMGFEPKAAAGVLTWANVGGMLGGLVFGFIATRVGLKRLTIAVLVAAAGLIIWFGQGASDIATLSTRVFIVGLFTNSAVVGLYALIGKVFPTHVRATGTGFAIGVGRGGAALAPVLGGYLFQAGFGLQAVATAMAMGSLLAALALLALKEKQAD